MPASYGGGYGGGYGGAAPMKPEQAGLQQASDALTANRGDAASTFLQNYRTGTVGGAAARSVNRGSATRISGARGAPLVDKNGDLI